MVDKKWATVFVENCGHKKTSKTYPDSNIWNVEEKLSNSTVENNFLLFFFNLLLFFIVVAKKKKKKRNFLYSILFFFFLFWYIIYCIFFFNVYQKRKDHFFFFFASIRGNKINFFTNVVSGSKRNSFGFHYSESFPERFTILPSFLFVSRRSILFGKKKKQKISPAFFFHLLSLVRLQGEKKTVF